MPHAAGHEEAIALLADVQIGDQRVELKGINLKEGIRDALRNMHFKSRFLKDGRQGETNAGFVVNKQQALASFVFSHRPSLPQRAISFEFNLLYPVLLSDRAFSSSERGRRGPD